jgi:HK97 family phage portal protein
MGALTRVTDWVRKAVEGAYRPGPYWLPISGGWLPDGAAFNWWQQGYDLQSTSSQSAMVEACVSAYSQTVSMLPGDHWRSNDKGGRDRVTTSALSRILRKPNEYESISNFLLNVVRWLYLDGNAYALALRNDRFEVSELHLMDSRQSFPQIVAGGEIFYKLAGNYVISNQIAQEAALFVPARDVLHIRLHASRMYPYPLRGESPLMAAMGELAMTQAMTQQQMQFYINQARPSAVLSTDLTLNRDKVEELRQQWNEQAKNLGGCGPGGVPILTHGIKVQPWSMAAKDTQIAEIMKLSDEKIALAFRVPLQVLGVGHAHSYASTELLMQSWIASGLGFTLEHVEQAFGLLFQLKGQPDEYVEFDTAALLRSAFKGRIEGLARAVQGGILAPNEARNLEGYENVPFGDSPRVQAQVVPLEAASGIPSAPTPHAAPAAHAAPEAPAPNFQPPKQPPTAAGNGKSSELNVRRHTRSILDAADRYDRRPAATSQ